MLKNLLHIDKVHAKRKIFILFLILFYLSYVRDYFRFENFRKYSVLSFDKAKNFKIKELNNDRGYYTIVSYEKDSFYITFNSYGSVPISLNDSVIKVNNSYEVVLKDSFNSRTIDLRYVSRNSKIHYIFGDVEDLSEDGIVK
ncbi:hypothetical protein [Flammeovirga agarivorans]|uniref:Uncharacterized protein n=1 Tax=Flammeovirga agarivorans TaxID=2726742 RepID=A0A7X8SRI0_9BACT|nr:hypothetical protein [Flammeovirga agarivorans]NLR95084.1 hypothetical protein [Flammeovirga agarivorans]